MIENVIFLMDSVMGCEDLIMILSTHSHLRYSFFTLYDELAVEGFLMRGTLGC